MADNRLEGVPVVMIESPSQSIVVTAWEHNNDGEPIVQITSRGKHVFTGSPTDATVIVRGLQRWLSALRNRAATV